MKFKVVTFLVLLILFIPFVSYADYQANLTVIVNTQGSDLSFHFEVDRYVEPVLYKVQPQNLFAFIWQNIEQLGWQLFDFVFKPVIAFAYGDFWQDYDEFDIQTQSLSGFRSLSIDVSDSNGFRVIQDNAVGLKIRNIFCISDNPEDAFFYQQDNVIFNPWPDENITCIFNNVKEITPVLIVPGLTGTEMKKGDELLWADILRMMNPLNTDSFMDFLAFNKNLTPIDSEVYEDGIIRNPSNLYDYTEGLINEFKNQGYAENESLFTFPYDWRYGVSGKFEDGATNADLLAQKIQDILSQTGADKVDIVAHSMGGLIVKKYVIDNPDEHGIGKAVFVGAPNTGAPKAIKVLLQGDNFGIPWLADSEMKKISENLPAAYDLLPDSQYYSAKGSYVQVVEGSGLSNTEKDLNYEETKSFLTTDHNLNSQAILNSETLRSQDFDNFDLRTAGVDLYNIVGCKAGTLAKIIELRYKDLLGNNQITYAAPKITPGDNTVPFESATNLPVDQAKRYFLLKSDHGKMLSQNGIRQKIVNILSSSALEVQSSLVTQDVSKCKLNGKAISIFSPVNIFITGQDGNRLGLADDGSIINEIPNANFEIMGEHKFIYLPTDGGQIYNIDINGTDSGIFTIKSEDIDDNEVAAAEVFSNIAVTPNLTGQINLGGSASGGTTLIVRQNSASQPETILPSAIINASQSEDLLPPISASTITGVLGQPDFYRSEVAININATDPIILGQESQTSDVLDIEYNLDDSGFQKIYGDTATINVSGEGKHTLKFFSADKAGNNEIGKVVTFIIDKIPPEAIIEFDPNKNDLKFSGTDNISDSFLVSVQDNDDAVILTDQAGNTTEIKFKEKSRKILMRVEIKSIKYNGVPADISKNLMTFLWHYDKNKNLKMLSQRVQSKKDYNILAFFDGKNTKIVGRDSSGKISKIFIGLKIIKITTKNGDFSWSY